MKRQVQLATLLITMLPFSATGMAKTWTGKISDSMCGAKHTMAKEHEQKGEVPKTTSNAAKDRECTLACVKNGGKYVLVSQGKVFEISNQDFAGLQTHAGHTVKLTGEMDSDGKTIRVSEITMPGKTQGTRSQHKEQKEEY